MTFPWTTWRSTRLDPWSYATGSEHSGVGKLGLCCSGHSSWWPAARSASSPIDTTITTTPISDLVFPTVTVCPPRESNTILNLPLQAVKNDSFTKQERDHLLDASFKIFLKSPNQRYARNIVDLVNKGNLMGLYEWTTSLSYLPNGEQMHHRKFQIHRPINKNPAALFSFTL